MSLATALVWVSPELTRWRVGGMSLLERTLHALARAGIGRLILIGEEGEHRDVSGGALRVPAGLSVQWIRPGEVRPETLWEAEGSSPVLVLLTPIVLTARAIEWAASASPPPEGALCLRAPGQEAVGARERHGAAGLFWPSSAPLLEKILRLAQEGEGAPALLARDLPCRGVEEGVFCPVEDPSGLPRAERALLGSLVKESDGLMARWVDRRLSLAITRHLAQTRLTPNQITLLTMIPAFAGAALLALPGRWAAALGALLFWLSTVLDGCDGELARLTYRESEGGGRLDFFCDNLAHLALFGAVVVHVHHERPASHWLALGAASLVGVSLSASLGYWFIFRPRIREVGTKSADRRPGNVLAFYERLASRDFAYLLPILALAGWLPWFLWATAIGSNVFWVLLLAVVGLSAKSRPAGKDVPFKTTAPTPP